MTMTQFHPSDASIDAPRTGPTLEYLNPDQLEVDPMVQRKFDLNFAKKLAADFNPDMVGTFEVSRRASGQEVVIDGQHRRAMLQIVGRGSEPTPCLVYTGLSTKDEALLFVSRNSANRKPNPVDNFRLRVLSGEVAAIDIDRVVRRHGLEVKMGGTVNFVSAVGSLEWIYDLGGVLLLDKSISVSHGSFGRVRDAVDGQILKGMALLLHRRGASLEVASLIDKLGKAGTPGRLLGTARSRKMATGKALHLELVQVMIEVYNKGRSSRRVTSI